MNKDRLIFVTNDDGYSSKGFAAAIEVARRFGRVIAVAPERMQSGMSQAITIYNPLYLRKVRDEEDVTVYAVSGTPVDCVKIAFDHLLAGEKIDLAISGINHGSNSAVNVTYSGTMGAVLEGCMQGIPSVGFSLLHHSMKADFSLSTAFVAAIAATVLEKGLPKGVCLNVNIPARVIPQGIKVCRAARGRWTDEYKRYLDPLGVPFYWLTGHFVNEEPEADDTDEYWLNRRFISVVPVTADQTDREAIKTLAAMFPEE